MALILRRKRADGNEEEIAAEALWERCERAEAALAEARWALGSIRDNVTAVRAVGAHEFAGAFLAARPMPFN